MTHKLVCLLLSSLMLLSGCTSESDEKEEPVEEIQCYESWGEHTFEDHPDQIEEGNGIVNITSAVCASFSWDDIYFEIVKDSMPRTCDGPEGGSEDCYVVQSGGENESAFESGETITLQSKNGPLCDSDCSITVRVKVDGDVVKSESVDLT